MPDLIGKKPFDALIELSEVIPEEQIEFQTQDEFPALPENPNDYTEWSIVNQSISPGASIGSNEKVVVTIKPNDECMARHDRIIGEFIDNQILLDDWDKDEISYSDLGDVLIIFFKDTDSENINYLPIGAWSDGFKEDQMQAEQLASSLSCDVVKVTYDGDWLAAVNIALNSQSPLSATKKAQLIAEMINQEGIEYAEANREKALKNLESYYFNSSGTRVEYENKDNVYYIALISPSSGTWTSAYSNDQETNKRKDNLQRMCNAAARQLQSKVSIGLVESDGSVFETVSATPTGFIFDKSTGKLS